MAKFDDKVMRDFEKYLQLQKSGEINMVSSRVQDILGITKEEHRFIMENYSEISKEFNDLKVVDEVIKDAKVRAEGKGDKEQGLENKSIETVKGQQ